MTFTRIISLFIETRIRIVIHTHLLSPSLEPPQEDDHGIAKLEAELRRRRTQLGKKRKRILSQYR